MLKRGTLEPSRIDKDLAVAENRELASINDTELRKHISEDAIVRLKENGTDLHTKV